MAIISINLENGIAGVLAKLLTNVRKHKLPLVDNETERLFLPKAHTVSISFNASIETVTGAIEEGTLITNSFIRNPREVSVKLAGENGTTLSRLTEAAEEARFFTFFAQDNLIISPMIIKDVQSTSSSNNVTLCDITFSLEEIEIASSNNFRGSYRNIINGFFS